MKTPRSCGSLITSGSMAWIKPADWIDPHPLMTRSRLCIGLVRICDSEVMKLYKRRVVRATHHAPRAEIEPPTRNKPVMAGAPERTCPTMIDVTSSKAPEPFLGLDPRQVMG